MHVVHPTNFLKPSTALGGKNHRLIALGILCAIVLLGTVSIIALKSVLRVAERMDRAKSYLLYGADLAENQQFAAAKTQVENARIALKDVESDIRPWKFMVIVPLVGRQVSAFRHIVATIDRLSLAFGRAMDFADHATTTIVGNKPLHLNAITPEQKRLFLAQLFQSAPVLQGIKADLDLAAFELDKVPDTFLLPPLSDAVRPLKEKLPKLQHTLTVALPLLEAVPLVSGYPSEQRYLFLFQNNDELRPTGGFIGTYGVLVLRDGDIQSLFTDNIYRLDRFAERSKRLTVTPPPQLRQYLNVSKWFLRDSNWSPDFPTAAKQALWFYEKESDDHRPIDGVLAVTPTVVVRLLKLLGPITIDNITFTPENVVDTLQFHVEKGYDALGLPDVERKEIIGRLTHEIVERLLTLPLTKLPDLLDVIEGSLRERHILLYEKNPELQKVAVSEGWDGSIGQPAGDFLMLVDANLAALKTDSVMERSLAYTVTPASGRLKATLTVTYHNTGLFSWKTTRYRSYTRLYAPKGSELIRATGFVMDDKKRSPANADVTESEGKTVFGGYLIVEPRETKTLTFEYLLPLGIDKNAYTLFVQKQAGTEAHPLRVQLRFDKKVRAYQPTGFTVERKGDTLTFPTDLRVDRQFRVDF